MKKTSLVAGFVLGVGVLFTLGACSTVEESGKWSLGQEPKR